MTPLQVQTLFEDQSGAEKQGRPFIYVVRGYEMNNNSNNDLAIAGAHGLDVKKLHQYDRLVIRHEPFHAVVKDLRKYQLFDFIGKFPRVKPSDNTGHALTNRLAPVFQLATRLMLNQYYLNDPTMPACAHTLKPKVA